MATPSTEGGTTFPVVYVVLGGAALLSTVIFPISFIIALRYYRRRSRFLDQRLPHASGVVYGGYIQQVEPKLFDVYVKPGLELHEPRFEYILPMAVRLESKSHAATSASSPAPSVLRTHHSLRSQDKEVDKAEAPVREDVFQTYDVAALVVMPHPHPVDSWGELGEYAIGTTKLVSSVSGDESSLFDH
ncbi:hypothetical protein BJ322DRAFT_1107707 [Thelephora terrestris]|uniref:Uncharacterized protein n=1 Tax=Thelephora terrestris TaxID=56493 RepID=A0A9P6HFL7_9AGAM|nr:hypothetical protein BJ322DRAFT_1107707 [Thelephora terrestris]